MKTILDLVILNLIQMILTVAIICLLASCAPYYSEDLKWIYASETLPRAESGYFNSGFFTIGNKILAQRCDNSGNQQWWKYNEESHSWYRGKYVTLGCADGNMAESIE